MGEVPYLHRMLLTLALLVAAMALTTVRWPLAEPRPLPVREGFDMTTSGGVVVGGMLVILAVVAFFAVFR